MPFHAAEFRGKERISDSAERSDFPMSPVLCKERRMSIVGSSIFADNSRDAGPSDRLHFLLVRFLYASEENE